MDTIFVTVWKQFWEQDALQIFSMIAGIVSTVISICIFIVQNIDVSYKKRIERLQIINQSVRQDNPIYTRNALEYYRNFYTGKPEKNMIIDKTVYQKGWIQQAEGGKFPVLKDVDINFIDGADGVWNSKKNPKPRFLPTRKNRYAENAKLHCGLNLQNLPAYALANVRIDNSADISKGEKRIALDIIKGRYFDFYDTCSVLEAEMAYWRCIKKKKFPNFKKLKLRNTNGDLLNFKSRFAAIGVNALTVLKNVEVGSVADKNYFLLHQRSGTSVAEGRGKLHVIPAGSYQPSGTEIPVYPETEDYTLGSTVIREFYEELFSKPELENAQRGKIISAQQLTEINVYFLGLCFEPLNTKIEILACIEIDVSAKESPFGDAKSVSAIESKIKANYEGKVKLQPLDYVHVQQYCDDPRSTPSFAQIMRIVLDNPTSFGITLNNRERESVCGSQD